MNRVSANETPHPRLFRPNYIDQRDEPWLSWFLEESRRFEGQPQRELRRHFQGVSPCPCPPAKFKRVLKVLEREWLGTARGSAKIRARRTHVFREAAEALRSEAYAQPRTANASTDISGEYPPWTARALATVCHNSDDSPSEIRKSLYVDLPGERLLPPLPNELSSQRLALLANESLIHSWLAKSRHLTLDLRGHARAVVRQAKLHGLLCNIVQHEDSCKSMLLRVSGPLAFFRHTSLYGRALSSLIPVLAWCQRFELQALCTTNSGPRILQIRTGDPIFPGSKPRPYDSKIEQSFARQFAKIAKDWDLIREPEPVAVGKSLIFPDFRISHRHRPSEGWLLEIVGYWTPRYLERKLRTLKEAGLERLILCIDEKLECGEGQLPDDCRLLRFRRRIKAEEVLQLISFDKFTEP